MNLVVGSTGLLGLEIARQLLANGQPTGALVRRMSSPGKRATLHNCGATLVEGDLKDMASLRRGCAGVTTVISTASSTFSRQEGDSIETVDHAGQLDLIDAAETEGVQRFVFVSFRPHPKYPCALSAAKQAVERRLQNGKMQYVILQASYFMEVWLAPMLGFDPLQHKVTIYGEGQNRLRWVSYRDVARIAALATTQPPGRGAVFEVGGPDALSPCEVVREFEAAGVADIACEFTPVATLEARYFGTADPMQKSFAALMLGYAAGDAVDIAPTLKTFPLRLTSVRDFVSVQVAKREPAVAHTP